MSTVGANKAAIAKYIREQETEDQIADQLSFKEYEDPFKDIEEWKSNARVRLALLMTRL